MHAPAPSGTGLFSSPKLGSAPPPNRITRVTIAFPESDRPDGREPTMPMPRKRSPARVGPDDRLRVNPITDLTWDRGGQ